MFSCTEKDKKLPSKQNALIALLAMGKDEPRSFPLTLPWKLVTELLLEEEIRRLKQAHHLQQQVSHHLAPTRQEMSHAKVSLCAALHCN